MIGNVRYGRFGFWVGMIPVRSCYSAAQKPPLGQPYRIMLEGAGRN